MPVEYCWYQICVKQIWKDQGILPLGQDIFLPEKMLYLIPVQLFLIQMRRIKKQASKNEEWSVLTLHFYL